MRVAYVLPQFPAEPFAAVEINALRRLGVEIEVFCMRPRQRDADRLLAESDCADLPVHHPGAGSVVRGALRTLFEPGLTARHVRFALAHAARAPLRQALTNLVLTPLVAELTERIRRGGFDVVHVFWGHYPSLVGKLVRDLGIAPVTHFLGAYDLRHEHACGLAFAREADALVTHTGANVGVLERLGVDRPIDVIYRGIDLRKVVSGEKEPGLFVVSGRLVPGKRVERAIAAFARIAARVPVPEPSLLLCGDGPSEPELRRAAAESGCGESIRFAGRLAQDRLFAALARATWMLFPSEEDRLPNSVKEAMAHGCVCVVSDTTGIEELVEHEVSGFVLGDWSPESVAALVERLAGDPERRAEIGRAAIAAARRDFDVAVTSRRYLELWQRLRAERA
jgi:glycosyltransferase involved in cell wall biosynthesis